MRHPEQKDSEVYLLNHTEQSIEAKSFLTKRRGDIAYDVYGNIIDQNNWSIIIYPLFVGREEYLSYLKFRRESYRFDSLMYNILGCMVSDVENSNDLKEHIRTEQSEQEGHNNNVESTTPSDSESLPD